MNDTNRMVLTIGLTAAILLGWYYFFRQEPPPQPEQPAPTAQTKTKKPPPAESPASKPTSQPTAKEGGPVAADVEGKQTTLKAPGAVARFTTTGGALRSWKMTDPRYRELVDGKLVPVDLVQTEAG